VIPVRSSTGPRKRGDTSPVVLVTIRHSLSLLYR
jgi:hypothetical protein